MSDASTIARALGGDVIGRNAVLAPGPGHSPRDRSLSIRLDPNAPDGFLIYSHAADDWRICRDYVRDRLGLPQWQPGDEQDRRIPALRRKEWDRAQVEHQANDRKRTEDDLARIARAVALWNEARDPRGTAAEHYLRARALNLPAELASAVLRFHPRCPWRNEDTGRTERIPALLAAFRSIDDNEITAAHRIRLDRPQLWPKTERRMLGVVHRAAVKLDAGDGNKLVIGEGVESAMAARRLGLKPAWALGSVGAISFFPVIDRVKNLIILGETGAASTEAVKLCARRWQGHHVQVAMPDHGSDLNDELMLRAAQS